MLRGGWHRRVVPVTTSVAGLVALLALLFPGVREQVALSATHEPQEYVALSFARAADGAVAVCSATRSQVRVGFVVDSALAESRSVDYVVTVGGRTVQGTVTVDPDESAEVTTVLPRPARRAYDIEVVLPGEERRIRAHCGGGRP